MALPSPPLPDPIALRDALRGLRHALRSSHATLSEAVTLDTLPPEAAGLTRGAVAAGEKLARGVDHFASGMLRRLLGGGTMPGVRLTGLVDQPDSAADDFAGFCYVGLTLILEQLGVEQALISESAARQAWQQVAGTAAVRDSLPALAAALYLALRQQRVLRELDTTPVTGLEGASVIPVALFAVLLWLLAPPGASGAEGLEQSRVLHRARLVAPDILRADSVDNNARLAELFAQNVPAA